LNPACAKAGVRSAGESQALDDAAGCVGREGLVLELADGEEGAAALEDFRGREPPSRGKNTVRAIWVVYRGGAVVVGKPRRRSCDPAIIRDALRRRWVTQLSSKVMPKTKFVRDQTMPVLMKFRRIPSARLVRWSYCQATDLNMLEGHPAVTIISAGETQTLTEVRGETVDKD